MAFQYMQILDRTNCKLFIAYGKGKSTELHLELIPLIAKVATHVGGSRCQVSAAAVEAQVLTYNIKEHVELGLKVNELKVTS